MHSLDNKCQHKYKTENIVTNQKLQQSDSFSKENFNNSNNSAEIIPCKRRRNALIFEQDNNVII